MKRYFDKASLVSLSLTLTSLLPHTAFAADLNGTVQVDGSSTVYPLTEAVAEEFNGEHEGVRVPVGVSGTGGGFKKFCANGADMIGASRPIKKIEEEQCSKQGVRFVDIPVAYDAITIIVNPKNTWVTSLTVSDLKKIWEPAAQGKITRWNQIRPEWPDQPIRLFGPGIDSGTFDYFTEVIVGKEDASRGDYTSSETDDVIVQGVAGDANSLGFLGVAYYEENKSRVKAVALDDERDDNGKGPQLPTEENTLGNRYAPLSRPLFVYVSRAALERPEGMAFAKFYVEKAAELSKDVGLLPLPGDVYPLAVQRLTKANTKVPLPALAPGQNLASLLSEERPKE